MSQQSLSFVVGGVSPYFINSPKRNETSTCHNRASVSLLEASPLTLLTVPKGTRPVHVTTEPQFRCWRRLPYFINSPKRNETSTCHNRASVSLLEASPLTLLTVPKGTRPVHVTTEPQFRCWRRLPLLY
ncbi:hypothetical protein RRG08_056086 [Elysia crispata]|uniref:Uncharacterized protein n=1 Tax=Elysia crispata TaxID=231223 RepID=A0AAE1DDG6_9GAST|nr:hypothetical protein RRG08_056086 [Elysia crispata]